MKAPEHECTAANPCPVCRVLEPLAMMLILQRIARKAAKRRNGREALAKKRSPYVPPKGSPDFDPSLN